MTVFHFGNYLPLHSVNLLLDSSAVAVAYSFAIAGTCRLLSEEHAGKNLSRSENLPADSIQACV